VGSEKKDDRRTSTRSPLVSQENALRPEVVAELALPGNGKFNSNKMRTIDRTIDFESDSFTNRRCTVVVRDQSLAWVDSH
jgi:hypothetical protein